MPVMYDHRCTNCAHEDESLAELEERILECPICGKNTFERIFKTFGVLQTNPTDSSNSWIGSKSRRTYGEGRAVNGY